MKPDSKLRFFAKAKNKAGELYVYDEIGAGMFSGIGPQDVVEALAEIGAVETLDIYINSPGGAVFDGMTIFNQLRRFAARKIVHIDGLAASIASVIAMVGDEIRMAPNAMMMIHDPWGICVGTAGDLRKQADAMDQVSDTIRDTYVARTKQSADDVAAWMAAETWMKADECKERGFVDVVETEGKAMDSAFPLLAKFRNAPRSITEQASSPKAQIARMEMSLLKHSRTSPAKN